MRVARPKAPHRAVARPRAARAGGSVVVSCRTARGRAWQTHVRTRARRVVGILGLGDRELSVALVGDEEMHGLNRQYRGRDRPTDVLAFALDEDASGDRASPPPSPALLGDVVISIDTAVAQAQARRQAVERTLDELLIHGVLHLIGYDHEISPAEARRMFRKAREVDAALGDAGPRRTSRRRPHSRGARRARKTAKPRKARR